jgi:hypothetical protein
LVWWPPFCAQQLKLMLLLLIWSAAAQQPPIGPTVVQSTKQWESAEETASAADHDEQRFGG